MDSLVVPDLDILRRWLEKLNLSFYECDSCQALHLTHMQNFDGIFDAKVDLVDNVILFSAMAEVRPTALIGLVGDLSQINASSLTVKAFIDIQDDNLPKLVACQALVSAAGVTLGQFRHFMQQAEEQISMLIMEARANDLLFMGEEDDSDAHAPSTPVIH
ncbi:YbjN domain-containing protein [Sodalis sp.]|uniref:YbjN domain-containing protein n=1 Tax=Sodalis sp. (in: enterobacteria) TaxID=1898979 RepID=UPI003872E878